MSEPVEAGQYRKSSLLVVWAVMWPHPRRKGFWVCASDSFPYYMESLGRKYLEQMTLVSPNYYGPEGHPGENRYKSVVSMTKSAHNPWTQKARYGESR